MNVPLSVKRTIICTIHDRFCYFWAFRYSARLGNGVRILVRHVEIFLDSEPWCTSIIAVSPGPCLRSLGYFFVSEALLALTC